MGKTEEEPLLDEAGEDVLLRPPSLIVVGCSKVSRQNIIYVGVCAMLALQNSSYALRSCSTPPFVRRTQAFHASVVR